MFDIIIVNRVESQDVGGYKRISIDNIKIKARDKRYRSS